MWHVTAKMSSIRLRADYDEIILYVMIPKLDGFQFCGELHRGLPEVAIPQHAGVPQLCM